MKLPLDDAHPSQTLVSSSCEWCKYSTSNRIPPTKLRRRRHYGFTSFTSFANFSNLNKNPFLQQWKLNNIHTPSVCVPTSHLHRTCRFRALRGDFSNCGAPFSIFLAFFRSASLRRFSLFAPLKLKAKEILFEIKIVEKVDATAVRLRSRMKLKEASKHQSIGNIALVRLGIAELLSACYLSSCLVVCVWVYKGGFALRRLY